MQKMYTIMYVEVTVPNCFLFPIYDKYIISGDTLMGKSSRDTLYI